MMMKLCKCLWSISCTTTSIIRLIRQICRAEGTSKPSISQSTKLRDNLWREGISSNIVKHRSPVGLLVDSKGTVFLEWQTNTVLASTVRHSSRSNQTRRYRSEGIPVNVCMCTCLHLCMCVCLCLSQCSLVLLATEKDAPVMESALLTSQWSWFPVSTVSVLLYLYNWSSTFGISPHCNPQPPPHLITGHRLMVRFANECSIKGDGNWQ